MKNTKRRLIVAMSTTIALFTFGNVTNAEEDSNVSTYESKELSTEDRTEIIDNLDLGEDVEISDIESLDDAMLYELSQDSGEIISITETETETDLDTNSKPSKISIMSMPTSDFKLTVVAQRISEKSGKDNFKFTATGDWKTSPTWEFEDTIALSWSDNFTLYSDYSYMYGIVGGKQTLKPGVRNDAKPEAAVGHDVDLQPAITDDKAVLVAKVYKTNSSGSANVMAKYGHVQLTASVVGLSFGAGGGSTPTIGFDVDWNSTINQAVPAYTSFNY